MTDVVRVKVRDVIRLLPDDGWYLARTRGSHHRYGAKEETAMTRYVVLIEPTATGFSAHAPDVPGCVATGKTQAEVEQTMREALEFHLEELGDEAIPKPQTIATYVEVAA
jgi:predicted RNase H-like HicB family nuclease